MITVLRERMLILPKMFQTPYKRVHGQTFRCRPCDNLTEPDKSRVTPRPDPTVAPDLKQQQRKVGTGSTSAYL